MLLKTQIQMAICDEGVMSVCTEGKFLLLLCCYSLQPEI